MHIERTNPHRIIIISANSFTLVPLEFGCVMCAGSLLRQSPGGTKNRSKIVYIVICVTFSSSIDDTHYFARVLLFTSHLFHT